MRIRQKINVSKNSFCMCSIKKKKNNSFKSKTNNKLFFLKTRKMFKKKEHQTLFMIGLLLVSPILYYRYRKDIIEFQRKHMWGIETKTKKPGDESKETEKNIS